MTLALGPDVVTTDVDDGLVLLDQRSGRYWQLNRTGAVALRRLLDGASLDEVAVALTQGAGGAAGAGHRPGVPGAPSGDGAPGVPGAPGVRGGDGVARDERVEDVRDRARADVLDLVAALLKARLVVHS
ncbi:lasso peptide biosynthesis PqqD family chaperone [Streptomyces sp. 4N509B]|uniref:lasso peptide biosynthesis PqqD family chaperone n=1 Tax=Streptomyces sp. 4N509B TaxID=3457413 RepID=UPI003FD4DE40